jgi:hypothetical protein
MYNPLEDFLPFNVVGVDQSPTFLTGFTPTFVKLPRFFIHVH